jgi:hypothetical protein
MIYGIIYKVATVYEYNNTRYNNYPTPGKNMPLDLTKTDIALNEEFYKKQFEPSHKLYSAMSTAEQEKFKDIVQQAYYPWLGLSDKILEYNPQIYQKLTEWLQRQEYISHISTIATEILEIYKQSNHPDYKIMQTVNNQYIKQFDQQQADYAAMITTFCRSYNSGNTMKF